MLWKSAQFFACIFLDSRDKSLQMLKVFPNDQRKLTKKEEQRERRCCRIRLQFTKSTVWPRKTVAYRDHPRRQVF